VAWVASGRARFTFRLIFLAESLPVTSDSLPAANIVRQVRQGFASFHGEKKKEHLTIP
jgi:hypothetical protein